MKQIAPNLFARGKNGSIYLRRRIPQALKDAYPRKKTHIVVCLHTCDLGRALKLQTTEDIRIDAEFSQRLEDLKHRHDERSIQRLKKMSDEQLKSLADYWVHRVLATDELVRSQGLDDEEFDEIGSSLQAQRVELGRMLASGRSDRILPAMQSFFYLCGLQFDLPPEETKRVASVFLGAVISAMDYRLQRHGGGVVHTDTVAPFVETPKSVANKAPVVVAPGHSWDEVFNVWRDYVPGRNKGTTIATRTPWLELQRLAAEDGIHAPEGVTPELMRKFVNHMVERGLEVVTLNERLAKIKSLFRVVKGKGILPSNPAADTLGQKESSIAKRTKKRLPFDQADLTNIFSSCIFNERQLRSSGQAGEASYWIPILMYFTGARTEEVAGLALADVVQGPQGGYFNIIDRPSPEDDLFDDEEGVKAKTRPQPKPKAGSDEDEHHRLLKNAASIRKVPIAPELVELGLFRYIDWLRERGHKSLFPSLAHDWHEKLSGAFSKFFGRYKKQILRIDNPKKVLYSFRHTMKDAMTTADIRSKYLKRILGHGSGEGSVTDGYGNQDVPLDVLTAEFGKIKFFPIPAQPWMPGKGFVKYPKPDKKKKEFPAM